MRLFYVLTMLALGGVLSFIVIAKPAWANEVPTGVIIVADAGTGANAVSNLTTATPFRIPPLSRITVQPSIAAYVCVDDIRWQDAGTALSDGGTSWAKLRMPYCDRSFGTGVLVPDLVAFPSSCQSAQNLVLPDGGFSSCSVTCVSADAGPVSCAVWVRQINGAPAEF